MRDKTLFPLLFLAAVSLLTPPVEAAITKWPGASCQSVYNSSDITFNTAGTVLNTSTRGVGTVICPVQMPYLFGPGETITVTLRFETSAAVSCTLRLTSTAGTIQDFDSGTSSPQAMLGLSIQNDTVYNLEYSANVRCTLPAASDTLGAQGIVSYLVNHPD
jgi:hypothetical protein